MKIRSQGRMGEKGSGGLERALPHPESLKR